MITITQTKQFGIKDEMLVLESAKELGRIHGRDDDWSPKNVEKAIEELELIGEGAPSSNGYEILSSSIVTDEVNIDEEIECSSCFEVFKQLEKAQDLINQQASVKQNDLEELKGLLPFFSSNGARKYEDDYGDVSETIKKALNVCLQAFENYTSSHGNSILIDCYHYNNDTVGRDHYKNCVKVVHGNDIVEIEGISILDRDDYSWGLTCEEPIVAKLNDEPLDEFFFEYFDKFIKLICPDYQLEYVWHNPVEPKLLSQAKAVISKNQKALSFLVKSSDF